MSMQDNVLFWARLIGTGHVGAIAPLLPRATWITPVTQPSARTRCDMWGAHYRRTNNICPIGSSQRCTMFHFLCFPFVRFRQPGFYFSPQPTSTRLIPHSRRSRSVKYDQIKCFCYCDLLEQRVCGNIDGHSADCANFNLLDMSRCFSVRGCSQSIRNVYHTEKTYHTAFFGFVGSRCFG